MLTHPIDLKTLSTRNSVEPIYGTGTPVEHGLTVSDVKQLLHYFIHVQKEIDIIAFELVEVSPLLDIRNKTAQIAFDIIASLLEHHQTTVQP
jgi:arginase family enzyme